MSRKYNPRKDIYPNKLGQAENALAFFERAERRADYDPAAFARHWTDLAYVQMNTSDWPPFLDAIHGLWDQMNRQGKYDLKFMLERSPAFQTACHQSMGIIGASEMVSVMKFCTIFKHENTEKLFAAMGEKIPPYLSQLQGENLASVLKAYKLKNVFPEAAFIEQLEKLPPSVLISMTPSSFKDFIHAQASLGINIKRLSGKVLAEAFDLHVHSLTAEARETALWSLAVLDGLNPDKTTASIARQIFAEYDIVNPATRNTFCLWFDIKANLEKPKYTNDASKCEIRLKKHFAAVGARILESPKTREMVFLPQVDIFLRYGNRDIVIEYDGMTHFSRDSSGKAHYSGSTLFNTALITKLQKDSLVLRLDEQSYTPLFNRQNPPANPVVKSMLDKSLILSPGAYAVKMGEETSFTPI